MPTRLRFSSDRILAACFAIALGCGDDSDPSNHGGAGGHSGSAAVGGSGGKGGGGGQGGKASGGTGGSHGGGGGKGGQLGGGGQGNGNETGSIKLVPNVVAGKRNSSGGGIGSQSNALQVGTPTATTLQSLKYYITSIQLCEDAELQGSGFSSTAGCINLYQNMTEDSPDYETYLVTQALADNTEGRYIDLMSADGQAALRTPVTLQLPIADADVMTIEASDGDDAGVPERPERQSGVYRYGLINFYRPIKVKAEFPIVDDPGNYFRTKAVTAAIDNTQSGGMPSERVEIGDTLDGETEETTYMLSNGGVVFVFQKPFVITQADVDAEAEILIDLVFNPESFGQAYKTSDCQNDSRVVVCDPENHVAIEMPFVRMSPVPRKQGEKTYKETYLVDYDASSQLRIELYYNDADEEASIQGVDTAIVYTAAPAGDTPSFNTVASQFVTQQGSVLSQDASVSLLDYQRQTNLEGLIRRQDGTLTIHCLYTGSVCSQLNDTLTRTYTYEGQTLVSN